MKSTKKSIKKFLILCPTISSPTLVCFPYLFLIKLSYRMFLRIQFNMSIRPYKKILVFRVTRAYLNLLVKPGIFFMFSAKKYNFMHFERRICLSKCIQLHFFPEKK